VPGARFDPYRPPVPDDDRPQRQNPGYSTTVICVEIALLMWCYNFCHDNHTHRHLCNGPLSGTTRVSRYQKGKINLDFTEARDSE